MKKRAIKVQLYFNKTQTNLANQSIGVSRFVYNRALFLKKHRYENFKESLSWGELSKMFTLMKKSEEYKWLNNPSRSIIEHSLKNLEKAYSRFFRTKKGFPRFKKKHENVSFVLSDDSKIIGSNHIRLPKFGVVRIKGLRNFKGKIKNVTITKLGKKYYATFCIDDIKEKVKKFKKNLNIVGIDVNIENFLTDSNGLRIENPKFKKNKISKIKFFQKKASKCKIGSQRKKRWNLKIIREYQKINNKKQDFIHKISNNYAKNHDIIIVENLKINNLLKNPNLAESISMISWGEFFRQLEYKAGFYGSCFLKVSPYNTSKRCNKCGELNNELTLKDRTWNCKKCNVNHQRDLNSAINIKKMGEGIIQNAIGDVEVTHICDIGNYLKIKNFS